MLTIQLHLTLGVHDGTCLYFNLQLRRLMIALQTQLEKLIAKRAVLLYKNGIERENLKG